MNWKIQKQVPNGIHYLSQWSDFQLSRFPEKCIINKQLPGCGFTEWVISNNIPSMRKEVERKQKTQEA